MEIRNKIFCGDCLEIMKEFGNKSIDMILSDLPYGITRNKWDFVIPMDKLWEQYERIIVDDGAIILTAKQPFTSMLIMSNLNLFKYEWIWEKTIGSGQLNIRIRPLSVHESILVFGKKAIKYFPQMVEGTPYEIKRKASSFKEGNYNSQRDITIVNTGTRFPRSVIKISNPRISGGHPTQKPVELFEYFIKSYSEVGDLVLDNCIGSGTTAEACIRTGRNFVGIEKNEGYYKTSLQRIGALNGLG
jgi:site-specific DNA-methyltransferase (adenine-specific)